MNTLKYTLIAMGLVASALALSCTEDAGAEQNSNTNSAEASLSACLPASDSTDTCETYCKRQGRACSTACQIWPDIPVGAAGLSYDHGQCPTASDGLMIPSCDNSLVYDAFSQCCCEGVPDESTATPNGQCRAGGESCSSFWECCSLRCAGDTCTACIAAGQACDDASPCCEGTCSSGTCVVNSLHGCTPAGGRCERADECCGGACNAGECG